jgi:hypothetical protein
MTRCVRADAPDLGFRNHRFQNITFAFVGGLGSTPFANRKIDSDKIENERERRGGVIITPEHPNNARRA